MTRNQAETVYDLISNSAINNPDSIAIRFIKDMKQLDDCHVVTYAELKRLINRTVRMLRELSGKSRPVVSMLLPNIPQAQAALWSAEIGGIANPLNPLLNDEALYELMSKADTDVVIALGPTAGSDIWEKAQKAARRLAREPRCIPVGAPNLEGSFESLIGAFDDAELAPNELPVASDICAYFHTGGTTGYPKLACHSHGNQVASAQAVVDRLQLNATDITLNGLPLFHVAGAIVNSLGSLAAGTQIILPTAPGFRNPETIQYHWHLIEKYAVTISAGIPTSMAAMLDVPVGNNNIESLRYLISGGAPVPFRLHELAETRVNRQLYQGYGMTESAGVGALPNMNRPPVPGAVGQVAAPVEVQIRGGEICLKGPNVFQGYLGLPSPVSEDGWLRTGDLGRIDEDGNLFITGRAKDLIIRSGHNIDPALIESCLEKHPAVSMAAAIGMPDDYAGELPVAYVQLRPGFEATCDELMAYAAEKIDERPACPKRVIITEALPVTAVGKIFKPRLRELITEMTLSERIGQQHAGVMVRAAHTDQGQLLVCLDSVPSEAAQWCGELLAKMNLNVERLVIREQ
ncbi:AMP-binding protein [Metapseudomonas otitidis]